MKKLNTNYSKANNNFLEELKKPKNEKIRQLYQQVVIEKYKNYKTYYLIRKKYVRWVLFGLWIAAMIDIGIILALL